MASAQAILAAYDHGRRTLEEPGFERRASGEVVCHFPRAGGEGFVSFSCHTDAALGGAIEGVLADYARADLDFISTSNGRSTPTMSPEAWGQPGRSAWIEDVLRDDPDGTALFVAYDGATPVSCARASFPVGGRFVGLWGGATLHAHRGRGSYRALV